MGKLHKFVASAAVMSAVAIGFTTLADADTYTVKSGDTLWDIARNNGTTVENLMKDNNLTSSLIFPGDQLTFQANVVAKEKVEATGTYRVVLGDTLYRIANKFGTTVDNLVALNKIANPNFILVGQELKIKETTVKQGTKPVNKETKVSNVEVKKEVKSVEKKVGTSVVETKKEEPKPVVAKVAEPAPAPVVAKPEVVAPTPVPAVPVVNTNVSNKAASILAAAKAQIGVYQDCTMLVTNALKTVGINFHGWPVGYMSLGDVVSESAAQPGDLVYYANGGLGVAHIAVYAGNGQAVHGGWNGNQTVLSTAYVGSTPVFIRVR